MGVLQHRYAVVKDGRAVPWDPCGGTLALPLDCSLEYFGAAVLALEALRSARPLTVYLVWDELEALPSYGPDVVALVLGDERHCMPAYASRVGALFKCFGTEPWFGVHPFRCPPALTLAVTAQYLRNRADGAAGRRRAARASGAAGASGGSPAPVHDLPLGYYKQVELPMLAMHERPDDVFFAGSIQNQPYPIWSAQRWLRPPKVVSREHMLTMLTGMAAQRRDLRINLGTVFDFDEARRADGLSYSQQLLHAKICVAPRGTTPETYRFYEGMRAGCVVISEPLPDTWCYRGSPAVIVHHWKHLERVIDELLADPAELQRRHEDALAWWRDRLSPQALGRYLVERVQAAVASLPAAQVAPVHSSRR